VIQVDASQGGGGADTGVVSATTTTQRGAAWAPQAVKTISETHH
jgi:hypothetical protein